MKRIPWFRAVSATRYFATSPLFAKERLRRVYGNVNIEPETSPEAPEVESFYNEFIEVHSETLPYHLRKVLKVPVSGRSLLENPLFNKGTAFFPGERDRLGIRGLLPPRRLTMELQIERALRRLENEETPLRKFLYMRDLHERNETLFHRVLLDNIEMLAPVIYTPTVAEACLEFGNDYRRPRGMYFSHQDHGDMGSLVHNWPQRDVRVIVVTDGSRILGLGDLGAHGMQIPIGKLALYCAAGGIAPHRVLPCVVDVGTDNDTLLNDPFYLGLQHPRIKGDMYFEILDDFMNAVYLRWPNVLVQFEDFSSDVAAKILNRYRDHRLCFNDDIQGTGAVAVAGVMSALKSIGKQIEDLKDQRFVIAGAGSAGLGVANALCDAMIALGADPEAASRQFWVCDVNGVLKRRTDGLNDTSSARFERDDESAGMSLMDTINYVKPTVLLGLTAVPGLFNKDVLEGMCATVDRPIIFPLSNPTKSAECTAEEAYVATNGRAIVASGSPFDPVMVNGKQFNPSQCNNMFIFPGLGLGAVIGNAMKISDSMIFEASLALVESVTAEERAAGQIFPSVSRIREVALHIATKVMIRAAKEDLIHSLHWDKLRHLKLSDMKYAGIKSYIHSKMYDPVYVPLSTISRP